MSWCSQCQNSAVPNHGDVCTQCKNANMPDNEDIENKDQIKRVISEILGEDAPTGLVIKLAEYVLDKIRNKI